MRLHSIALAAALALAATGLSGCLTATTAGSTVAGAAIGATSAVVKTTAHLTRAAVNAVTPNNSSASSSSSGAASDKNEAH